MHKLIPLKVLVSLLSTLLWLCLLSVASVAQYRFDHWTADNGLPQNSVRDIVQTRDGYLWMTTFDGLVRFDGVRFTVFNKSNIPGLASNRFFSLFEDRSGDLWASLETGQLVRRHEGRFTIHNQQNLRNDSFSFLSDDGEGNVALRYLQTKVEGNKVTEYIWHAFRYREGHFQPVDEQTYSYSQLQALARTAGLGKEANSLNTSILFEGDLWATTKNSVVRFLKGGGVQVYSEGKGLPGKSLAGFLGKPLLQVPSRDAAGRLWMTELKSGQSQLLSQQTPEGFDVWRTYADNEGNYWFATLNNGLFRARRQTVTPYAQAQGLDSLEVYPMLEGRDGSLWIGAVDLFRLKDGAFTRYNCEELYFRQVTSLYEDRAGQLWVNGGWRIEGNRLVRAAWAKTVADPFISVSWTMCEDREGAYWIGSTNGVVRHLNGVNTYYTTKDGLAGNDTKVIIKDGEDGQGGLWLGSSGGLTHYKDGKFTAWTEKDGLPGATVRALKQDTDGTLWIGTYDSGLGRFKDGKFTRYTIKGGLFDNGVFQILEDDFGWFWMNSNRGIYRVRKQELLDFAAGHIKTIISLAYTKSDGMPSSEGNGGRWPAGVKTRDGKLWFPTMGGVAMIDPSQIKANTQPPPVVLEELRINNQPASLDAWDAALHNLNSAIQIYPGQDNFEIAYTALSFVNSENMRFKYKLEGADTDWVDAGTRRTAYFSHLTPGHYTFRVIAANADGVWNEKGASVRITVVPPFWRTWWFLTLVALGLAGLVASAWQYRISQLRRVQLAQQIFARRLIESQETERKRIAAELHDSLGQNLLVIKNRAMINALTLQDERAKTQFDEFSAAVSHTLEEVRTISHDLRPPHLDQLGLRTALVAMIEKVAASSTIQFTHTITEVDGLLPPGDEIMLYRIVQESLNNILKHSGARAAEIKLHVKENQLTLAISDNGRGFTQNGNTPERTGLGLQGIAERARILGGMHEVISSPGEGTTVIVRIELKDK